MTTFTCEHQDGAGSNSANGQLAAANSQQATEAAAQPDPTQGPGRAGVGPGPMALHDQAILPSVTSCNAPSFSDLTFETIGDQLASIPLFFKLQKELPLVTV